MPSWQWPWVTGLQSTGAPKAFTNAPAGVAQINGRVEQRALVVIIRFSHHLWMKWSHLTLVKLSTPLGTAGSNTWQSLVQTQLENQLNSKPACRLAMARPRAWQCTGANQTTIAICWREASQNPSGKTSSAATVSTSLVSRWACRRISWCERCRCLLIEPSYPVSSFLADAVLSDLQPWTNCCRVTG